MFGPRTSAGGELPPFDLMEAPANVRDVLRRVMQAPTVMARGPWQVFPGDTALYLWMLEHPDQGVRIWRRFGAKCMDITAKGQGRFAWSDGHGSEIHWSSVVENDHCMVWYAEGTVHPTLFLPTVPVRAVVVLRHSQEVGPRTTLIHQQADLYFLTDSKAAVMVARLLGPSAPHLAEQCVGQLETFFSALVWYLNAHPSQLRALAASAAMQGAP
jgi:hypothetical protein